MSGGLPERELNGLLELLGEAHHADDLASFRTALLDALPRLIPAAYTSYNEVGADGNPLVTLVTPDPGSAALTNWSRYGHQNPLVQRSLQTRDPRPTRLSDVIEIDVFRGYELYEHVFRPMGVEHQLAITLPAPPKLLIGLVFADAEDFTDAQVRLLDLARPHLIQAHANAALRERMRDVLLAVEAGLEDIGEAVVVADSHDRIALATTAGRAALEQLGGGQRLPEALRSAGPHNTVLETPTGSTVVRKLAPREGTSVLLFDSGGRAAPRSSLAALGLSAREAEVLQAMMRGRSTAAIAQQLGVSTRTVYKHAENLYAKLGVNDRIAAVSAAWAALDSGA